jgi:hypothetical protein
MMMTIADFSMGKEASFDSQSLSQLAWSFGTLAVRHVPLFTNIAYHCVGRLNEFSPQASANLTWAFSVLDMHLELWMVPYPAPTNMVPVSERKAPLPGDSLGAKFLEAVAADARTKLNKLNRHGLTSLALALAKMSVRDTALFAELEKAIVTAYAKGSSIPPPTYLIRSSFAVVCCAGPWHCFWMHIDWGNFIIFRINQCHGSGSFHQSIIIVINLL